MPLPIFLTLAYLAVNLGLMLWLERARAAGQAPARGVPLAAGILRYGPPLAGVLYLEAIAGDWLFLAFVLAFFAGAFWLMNGLLAFTNTGPRSGTEAMRRGWDDRGHGRPDGERPAS